MTKRHRLPALVIVGVLCRRHGSRGDSRQLRRVPKCVSHDGRARTEASRPEAARLGNGPGSRASEAGREGEGQRPLAEEAVRNAKTPAKKAALKKSVAKAQVKVKSLEKALANAKSRACDKGYRLSGSSCVATG